MKKAKRERMQVARFPERRSRGYYRVGCETPHSQSATTAPRRAAPFSVLLKRWRLKPSLFPQMSTFLTARSSPALTSCSTY